MDLPANIDPIYITKKRKPTTIKFWNRYLSLCATYLRQQIRIKDQTKQNFLCFPIKKTRTELGRYRIKGKEVYAWDVFFYLYPFFVIDQKGNQFTGLTTIFLIHKEVTKLFNHIGDAPVGFTGTDLTQLPVIPINRTSLDNYIKTQTNNLDDPSKDKALLTHIRDCIAQARQIASLADEAHAQGVAKDLLPYTESTSDFGRTYHKGTNLISTPSAVRHAALGDCWELDLENAVLAYKLGMLEKVYEKNAALLQASRHSRDYLLDKAFIRKQLARRITAACHELPGLRYKRHWTTLHEKNVKQALTAIMFGAGSTSKSWVDQTGRRKSTALKYIFREQVLVDVFLESPIHDHHRQDKFVTGLIKEQKFINDAVIEANQKMINRLEPDFPEFFKTLKTRSGTWNKKILVAFLYQHAEQELMDEVCKFLGNKVLLRVHDAVYIRGQCDIGALNEIAERHGPYMKFGVKRHRAYGLGGYNRSLAEHQAHMEQEISDSNIFRANVVKAGVNLHELL